MRKFNRTPRVRVTHVVVLACLLMAAVVISACGGSSKSTSSSSTTAVAPTSTGTTSTASLTGSTIKLGLIASVGTPAVNVPDVVAAAKAGVRQVNSEGGISGHPVELDFCNEDFNPNTARACSRKMVTDHVMAMVTNSNVTAEADGVATFKAAGIPDVGPVSFSGAAASDSNSYMLGGDETFSVAAMAQFSVLAGAKRIALALLTDPFTSTYKPILAGVTPAVGGTFVGDVAFSGTESDLSTQAAALIALKPQSVLLEIAPAQGLALMKSMSELGYTGKYITDGAQYYESNIQALGPIANQLVFTSPFPPVTDTSIPGNAKFLAAVTAEKASGDSSAIDNGPVFLAYDQQAWLSVIAVAKIANAAKATDAASFKKAIDAAKNVDLDGVIPSWTPNQTFPGAVATRVVNGNYYGFVLKGSSTLSLLSPKPVDVTPLVNKYYPKS